MYVCGAQAHVRLSRLTGHLELIISGRWQLFGTSEARKAVHLEVKEGKADTW